jgi:hypothetical protein
VGPFSPAGEDERRATRSLACGFRPFGGDILTKIESLSMI